jgi:hypothetical protein
MFDFAFQAPANYPTIYASGLISDGEDARSQCAISLRSTPARRQRWLVYAGSHAQPRLQRDTRAAGRSTPREHVFMLRD